LKATLVLFFAEVNQILGDVARTVLNMGRAIKWSTYCSLWCAQNIDSNGAY